MTLVLLLGIAVALAGAFVALAMWTITDRPECPECGSSTYALRSPLWVRWTRLPLCARWCLACGWEGWARSRGALHPPTSYLVFRWGERREPPPGPDTHWEAKPPRRHGGLRKRPARPPEDPPGWKDGE